MSVTLMIRHGQASFGIGSYDRLSDHGRAQVEQLGAALVRRGVVADRVICGTLARQRETAAILAGLVGGGAPLTVDDRWNEYELRPVVTRVRPMYRWHWLMVADLARSRRPSGTLQEVIDEGLLRWTQATDDQAPSFADYNRRIAAALGDVTSQQGTSIVVSSAGTIAAAIAPLIGVEPAAWPGLHRVMVNSSITKVVRGDQGPSMISFNDHGHLEGVPGLRITYR